MVDYLNDDCLSEIFKYLGPKGQMAVIAVNKRFRSIIVERFWRLKYKTIILKDCNILGDLTIEELHLFHSLIAPHAIKFIIAQGKNYNFYDHYLKLEYPEVRVLKCQNNYFDNHKLMTLFAKCPKIEELHLKDLCPTNQQLAQLFHLRELVLNINSLEPKLFKKVFNDRTILRMYLDDFSKFILKKNTHFINSTDIIYNLTSEQIIVLNFRGQMTKLIDFIYSFRTLNELYFYADITFPGLFRLIDNNLQLEHLYLGRGFDVAEGSGKWLCRLSDHLREGRQHKQVITIHLDWPEKYIQKSQKTLQNYDVQCGHPEPAIRLQKLFEPTSGQTEDSSRCCCFRLIVQAMNTRLQQFYEYDDSGDDFELLIRNLLRVL